MTAIDWSAYVSPEVREKAARRAKLAKLVASRQAPGPTNAKPEASITPITPATLATLRRPPTDWERALAQALADVQVALGTGAKTSSALEPLFVDARDLFSRDYPATPWLVQGLITRGATAVIGGEPKTAKTWSGTEIAIAVATGTPAFGEFSTERGRVAYFYAEDLDKQVRNRLRALLAGRALGVDALGDRLHAQPRGRFVDLTSDESLALVVASCRRLGKLDLVLLDPLRDLHSGEEDKSDAMREVMRRLRLLGELVGCTIAVVHHTAKASADSKKRRPGQRLRGSGAIHGSVDCGIYLGDLKGDGVCTFVNSVDVEIKGARGAGHFDLEIAIDDDACGEATRATWKVKRETLAAGDTPGTARDKADEQAILVAMQRETSAGRTYTRRQWRGAELRELHKVPEKRTSATIDRLLGSKQLTESNRDPAGFTVRYPRLVPATRAGAD